MDKEPLVRLFVMGADTWLTGETYPLEKTAMTKLFLTSGGKANTGKGDAYFPLIRPGARKATPIPMIRPIPRPTRISTPRARGRN